MNFPTLNFSTDYNIILLNETENLTNYYNNGQFSRNPFLATSNSTGDVPPLFYDDEDVSGPIELTLQEFEDFAAKFSTTPSSPMSVIPTWIYIILILIGIIGNLANIVVFTRPTMATPVNLLLTSFEAINIVLFLTFLPWILRSSWGYFNVTFFNAILDAVNSYVETFAVCVSNWLSVTVGIFRLVAVGFPLKTDVYCNKKRAVFSLLVIIISSAILSLPFAFLDSYEEYPFLLIDQPEDSNSRTLYFSAESEYAKRSNGYLMEACNGLTLITTSVPCFSLAVVTFLLLMFLWLAHGRRENLRRNEIDSQNHESIRNNKNFNEIRITITLIILLAMFFLAYLPDAIVNVLIYVMDGDALQETTVDAIAKTRICILISNAFTFFFYFLMSERFRTTFKQVFGKVLPRRMSNILRSDTKMSSL